MEELKATGDPRASGGGAEFDDYIWYQGRRSAANSLKTYLFTAFELA